MLRKGLSLSISVFLLVGALSVWQLKTVHAYIDLSTGSALIQMLLATGLTSLFMVKIYWSKITGKVSRLFSKTRTTDADSD